MKNVLLNGFAACCFQNDSGPKSVPEAESPNFTQSWSPRRALLSPWAFPALKDPRRIKERIRPGYPNGVYFRGAPEAPEVGAERLGLSVPAGLKKIKSCSAASRKAAGFVAATAAEPPSFGEQEAGSAEFRFSETLRQLMFSEEEPRS